MGESKNGIKDAETKQGTWETTEAKLGTWESNAETKLAKHMRIRAAWYCDRGWKSDCDADTNNLKFMLGQA